MNKDEDAFLAFAKLIFKPAQPGYRVAKITAIIFLVAPNFFSIFLMYYNHPLWVLPAMAYAVLITAPIFLFVIPVFQKITNTESLSNLFWPRSPNAGAVKNFHATVQQSNTASMEEILSSIKKS